MGTWSAAIFGNDTYCEVKDFFYLEYNSGKAPEDLINQIFTKFEYSLNNEDDRNNVLFALAWCLWETKSLPSNLLEDIHKTISEETDLKIWKTLNADEKILKKRKKFLHKFLDKISNEKTIAKKRVKLPKQMDAEFKTGTCLSFLYPNNLYGGIIVIDCELYRNHGNVRYALTDIEQESKPDLRNFYNAKLMNFRWAEVSGQAMQKAAFDNKTARFDTYLIRYDKATGKKFFGYNSKFFEACGQLPAFTQCLLSTSGRSTLYEKAYDEFEKLMAEKLFAEKNERDDLAEPASKETIEELCGMLVKK